EEYARSRRDEIDRGRLARPEGQLAVEQKQIRARERPGERQRPVKIRNALPRRRPQGWIEGVGQKERKAEVDRACLGIIKNADAEDERQRRRVPKLEQRPSDRYANEQLGDQPGGFPAARV